MPIKLQELMDKKALVFTDFDGFNQKNRVTVHYGESDDLYYTEGEVREILKANVSLFAKIQSLDIDCKLRDDITTYFEKFGARPKIIIISKPLMSWLKHTLMEKAKYANTGMWKQELNCQLMTFEGLTIIETLRDNIIEVF